MSTATAPAPAHAPAKTETHLVYRRFSAFHRFNHYLVMISFFGLVLTGIPLKFKDSYFSQVAMDAVGGVAHAGFAHRTFALMNILYFVLEIGYMAWYVVARKGHRLRSRLHRPKHEGLAGPEGHVPLVLRAGAEAAVQPLRLLGEVRLLGALRRHRADRWLGSDDVVPGGDHQVSSPGSR